MAKSKEQLMQELEKTAADSLSESEKEPKGHSAEREAGYGAAGGAVVGGALGGLAGVKASHLSQKAKNTAKVVSSPYVGLLAERFLPEALNHHAIQASALAIDKLIPGITKRHILGASALGALGGASVGSLGGLLSGSIKDHVAKAPEQEVPKQEDTEKAASTDDDFMTGLYKEAADAILNPQLPEVKAYIDPIDRIRF